MHYASGAVLMGWDWGGGCGHILGEYIHRVRHELSSVIMCTVLLEAKLYVFPTAVSY